MKRILSLVLALFATSALAVDIPVRNPSSGGAIVTPTVKVDVAAACGTNGGNVCSGTYTPTSSATQNVDSLSIGTFYWMRVGNVMQLAGVVSVDATSAATFTKFRLTLPFTRPSGNFTSSIQCAGTGATNTSSTTNYYVWVVTAINASQVIELFVPGSLTSSVADIHFTITCSL